MARGRIPDVLREIAVRIANSCNGVTPEVSNADAIRLQDIAHKLDKHDMLSIYVPDEVKPVIPKERKWDLEEQINLAISAAMIQNPDFTPSAIRLDGKRYDRWCASLGGFAIHGFQSSAMTGSIGVIRVDSETEVLEVI